MKSNDGRKRVVIEAVSPEIEGSRFPAKRIVGDKMVVEADIFSDGHDVLSASLLYREADKKEWAEEPMRLLNNDRWQGTFFVEKPGHYLYTISAWVDEFKTWRNDFKKRLEAKQEDLDVYVQIGIDIVAVACRLVSGEGSRTLSNFLNTLKSGNAGQLRKQRLLMGEPLADAMDKYADHGLAVTYSKELSVIVEREKARFSTWYEMFPRSCSNKPGRHGTFKDCEARLSYISEMGFDVLYLPPIHPIGVTNRKGKNNTVTAGKGDPGTPWAIGSEEGGHKSIHPQLGTIEDFRHFVSAAKELGIEIALDIAFQCSPDHPYVSEHPEWFTWRPDGIIQYAENPPKKYQDIYPLNFTCDRWSELWDELKSIVLFWVEQGVCVFRVDNPHTKPFLFWEWLIAEVNEEHPEVIFLAEAFTRPKIMYRLAKLGFTQSYTYFTWRNTKSEITEYVTELTQTEVKDFFRPNFWPNTPDILHEYLQTGGRPAFMIRLVLAATLSPSYGIYGPVFELMENIPREKGSEEYLNSEKYEIKHWDVNTKDSLKEFITLINRIRRENPVMRNNLNLWFNATDNDNLICYSRHTEDLSNIILVVVNLDPHNPCSGRINFPLKAWGLDTHQPFIAYDLLSGTDYTWQGEWNSVALDPDKCPARIFRVTQDIKAK
jgi:starch synthase (maltosyl-transferring)